MRRGIAESSSDIRLVAPLSTEHLLLYLCPYRSMCRRAYASVRLRVRSGDSFGQLSTKSRTVRRNRRIGPAPLRSRGLTAAVSQSGTACARALRNTMRKITIMMWTARVSVGNKTALNRRAREKPFYLSVCHHSSA